ncbi:MAG: hypothetical protein DMH00_13290, partial [Acidobacteria bacterium]
MAVIRPCSGTGPQALSTFGLQQAVALLLLALAGAGPGFATPKKPPEETGAGGWPEISAEERSLSGVPQDPATDAVLLRNDREGKIIQSADDTVNLLQYHWRLKVLKPSGKAYAEVKIPADKYSRVSNIQARTVKADGTIVPVTPDQIFEKVVRQVGDFKLTEMVFDFPAVEPGAILEYRYDRRVDFLVSITPWYFEGPVFTLRSRVKQSIPMGMGYSILCDLCQGAKPEVADFRDGKSQGQSYTMELKNLPGYRAEDFMPPAREVSPRMEMVLQAWRGHMMSELGRQDRMFVDWASIAKYADVRYQAATKPATETLKSLVAAWTQGLNDPQEKTRAILQHVRHDFRYLPYRVVYGYSRPLDAVVKSGYADNEEKAVLLQAAMKAAGIASDIALVSGKDVGSLNPKFSSFT